MRTIICLVGPTGTGKSSLERALNMRGIPSIVSFTTRPPRHYEVPDQDYYFLGVEAANDLDATGHIVQQTVFAGHRYGSTTGCVNRAFEQSDTVVIVVEPSGVDQFKDYYKRDTNVRVESVYIDNSLKTLVARLMGRYKADDVADEAHYADRMVQLFESHHKWPFYSDNWSMYVTKLDDSDPNFSIATTANDIVGAFAR